MAETNGQILAKRWQEWRESPEGEECRRRFAEGQYLENRLWRAFMAGAAAPSLPSAEELADKLRRRVNFSNNTLMPIQWLEVANVALAALSSDKVSKEVSEK